MHLLTPLLLCVGVTGHQDMRPSQGGEPREQQQRPLLGARPLVPRASPNCNVWGASSQWAIYEPESHSRVADKYYGDLYVVQNEDRIITQVTYNPRDTLFCLGSFTWLMDEVGLVTVNPAENRRSYSSVVRRSLSIPRPLGCPLSHCLLAAGWPTANPEADGSRLASAVEQRPHRHAPRALDAQLSAGVVGALQQGGPVDDDRSGQRPVRLWYRHTRPCQQ